MNSNTAITGDKSEEIYSTIFRISSSMLSISRIRDGRFIEVNDAFLTTLGYSREEMIGKTSLELGVFVDPEDRVKLLKALEQNGQARNIEIRIRAKDKTIFDILFSADKITIGDEKCWLIAATDITGRKRTEDALRLSLQEKTTLIREIHHRVKNNMQIISSLLQLQSNQINDGEMRRFFNEAKDRIRSMSLVHEKLYNTEHMETIDLAAYANDLVIHLFRSHGINDNRIKFRLTADEVKLDIDDAVPVALILNELLSNSLKYAFPAKKEGEIYMRLEEQHGIITIELADNGVGMPADLQINNAGTLGLKLVQALTKQIKGSIELTKGDGAHFILSFKKK